VSEILKTINSSIRAIGPKLVTLSPDKTDSEYEKIEDEMDNNFETYYPDIAKESVKTKKETEDVFDVLLTNSGIPWIQSTKETESKSEINIQGTKNPKLTTEELRHETKTNLQTIKTIQESIDLESKIIKKPVNKSKNKVLDIVHCRFTPEELAREKHADVETRKRLKEIIESKLKTDEQTELGHFFDFKKGVKYYLDRYNKENIFKDWFDTTFPNYTIKEALELAIPCTASEPQPQSNELDTFDPNKDLQNYIDLYNNDPLYKGWVDRKYPGQSIYEIIGMVEPILI